MGNVITFYSYQGGVGRTMALANVAVLLAQWGYKVLIVDWDLEAPGLENFFKDYLDVHKSQMHPGLIDLLDKAYTDVTAVMNQSTWQEYLINIAIGSSKDRLYMLTAGKAGSEYLNKVRNLDIQVFYAEKNGGHFIESLRNEWKEAFDFVLIDSRTGITDIGGICTIQLPDILVILFTATEQSLHGAIKVAEKANVARQKLPVERLKLLTIPIPGRFDTQTEFKISQQWLDRFASVLGDVYADWLPISVPKREMLELSKIPYVSYFSFDEKLPVLEQGVSDPAGLGYAYETLAALIANQLEYLDKLPKNRDDFVRMAQEGEKRKANHIFICYSHKDKAWKDRLVTHLSALHQQSSLKIWDDRRIAAGSSWQAEMKRAIEDARLVILLVSANFLSSDFLTKKEAVLLFNNYLDQDLPILPIIIKPCAWDRLDWLAQLSVLPPDGQPLSIKTEAEIDAALAAIAHTIADVIGQNYLLNLSVLRSKRLVMKEKPENYRQKFTFRF